MLAKVESCTYYYCLWEETMTCKWWFFSSRKDNLFILTIFWVVFGVLALTLTWNGYVQNLHLEWWLFLLHSYICLCILKANYGDFIIFFFSWFSVFVFICEGCYELNHKEKWILLEKYEKGSLTEVLTFDLVTILLMLILIFSKVLSLCAFLISNAHNDVNVFLLLANISFLL